ncbi:MAG: isoleucine--tRNA ligase [Simkaniaceae bacterium]|nr:isoleucine--tRNA ligase [Simkaniaceae bacterium]
MFTIHQESFPERELRILAHWKNKGIFKASLKMRETKPLFSFYDGPPFATGLPHYGHLLAGTIKDVIPRYKTMKGFYVPRRFGWDCHGLPVENEIEKAFQLSGAPEIETFGIASFNEECRSIVLRYTSEWRSTVERFGRWVDFDHTYRTMDPSFMESVWWVFGELWKKGLVYEGFKVMPFSAKLGTPLSNFEANLNYKDVDDPSLTITFPLKDEENTHLLVWTTTPWTLISNLAAVVSPTLDYVKIQAGEKFYILARSRVSSYFKEGEYEIVQDLKGKDLKGKTYLPPFTYFKDHPGAFRILVDEFVGGEDGTGIVHAAPAFGEADFFVCLKEKIEVVCPVDQNGRFTKEIPEYTGEFVKDADKAIIKRLKDAGRVFHHGQIRHRYPFCWRSDTPLIYKVMKTWFVSVEKIKEEMIAHNQTIRWVPDHVKDGRFGKWLENARDWAISRNRYWGTPIPLWISEEGDVICISSVADLEKRTGKKIEDLHRHYIDELTFEEGGKTYKRIPEVFDCWFESGSMPYAQNHYPFENQKETENSFPADFIAEGLDQTRGWFYTLMILSTALFNKPAFKNVIVNGIILAEDGTKMSKRLKNYPEPTLVIDKYGADAVRLFLLNSPAVVAEDLKFSERGVELVLRQFLIPYWNAYVFLATYAKIYDWKAKRVEKPTAEIDEWILSRLQHLIGAVADGLDQYNLNRAVEPFVAFIDSLTNWYIRRSRSRFWADEDSADRRSAFETLYTVLIDLSKVAAPFIPFLSDAIFQGLSKEQESVHLCDYPTVTEKWLNTSLEGAMDIVQCVVSMGHALRKEHMLKVRQPLPAVHIITADPVLQQYLEAHKQLILEELNVKELQLSEDESAFVHVEIKPNFPVLGKKLGPRMKEAQAAIAQLTSLEKQQLRQGNTIELAGLGPLAPEDIILQRQVKESIVASSQEGVTVALNTVLTEELLLEGLARELVNKVNTMRRNEKFEVTDRIHLKIQTTPRVKEAFEKHKVYICHEILATQVEFMECSGQPADLNEEPTWIEMNKA